MHRLGLQSVAEFMEKPPSSATSVRVADGRWSWIEPIQVEQCCCCWPLRPEEIVCMFVSMDYMMA